MVLGILRRHLYNIHMSKVPLQFRFGYQNKSQKVMRVLSWVEFGRKRMKERHLYEEREIGRGEEKTYKR